MALPDHIADREHRKFVEDADGNVSVRIGPNAIKDADGNTLDLNSDGMAQVFDRQVMNQLKEMTDYLNTPQLLLINSVT